MKRNVVTADDLLAIAAVALDSTVDELRAQAREGALEGITGNLDVTFDGQLLFWHPVERAALVAERLVLNPPFASGNERVALLYLLMALDELWCRLTVPKDDVVEMLMRLSGIGEPLAEEEFREWVVENTRSVL